MPFKPVRQQLKHYHRYAGYDYSRGASLFISLSTDPRQRVFGDVADGKMALNDLGREVDRSISFSPPCFGQPTAANDSRLVDSRHLPQSAVLCPLSRPRRARRPSVQWDVVDKR